LDVVYGMLCVVMNFIVLLCFIIIIIYNFMYGTYTLTGAMWPYIPQ
jgi:hypothetical protein